MKRHFASAFALFLASGSAGLAQDSRRPLVTTAEPPTAVQAEQPPTKDANPSPEKLAAPEKMAAPATAPAVVDVHPGRPACAYRVWGSAEYLSWCIRGNPIPALLTQGVVTDPVPGATDQPGTTILLSQEIEYPSVSGGRFTVGSWLRAHERLGVEGGVFTLSNVDESLSRRAPADPAFSIHIPILLNGTPGATIPLDDFAVTSHLELRGAHVHALWNLCRSSNRELNLLGGVRYVQLDEDLTLRYHGSPGGVPSVGIDSFQARNEFVGGLLGVQWTCAGEKLSLDMAGKVSLGNNRRWVTIDGFTQFDAGGGFQGAALATPANIGRTTEDGLSVIPEFQIKVGYSFHRCVRVTAGYSMLWWSNVSRAGDAVDPVVGNGRPQRTIRDADFLAHGLTTGLELRW